MKEIIIQPGSAIQPAIDNASASGGGKVILAPGVHRTGTVYLKDNVELHLPAGSRLQGGDSPEDYDDLPSASYGEYAPCKCPTSLSAAVNAENIAITGSGVIDGCGPAFYNRNATEGGYFYAKTEKGRPRLLQLVHCRNIRLEGVTFQDSPGWTTWLIECTDVTVRSLRIVGDPRMINNDGLHFFGGKRISVSDCFISTGDDAIVVRAGRAWTREEECLAEDIVVTNCVLESSCQGIRVGCSCDDKVRDCRFSNLIIRSRNVGIYIDNPVRYLTVACPSPRLDLDNISFDHISVESQTKPFAVEVEEGLNLRRIGRISFSNIIFKGNEPLCFTGSEETPLEEIRLSNVSGTVFGPESIRTRFVTSLAMDHCTIAAVPAK